MFFKVIFRRRDKIYENCRNIISKYQQQYVLSNNTIKRFRNLCLPHVKCAVSQKLTLTYFLPVILRYIELKEKKSMENVALS